MLFGATGDLALRMLYPSLYLPRRLGSAARGDARDRRRQIRPGAGRLPPDGAPRAGGAGGRRRLRDGLGEVLRPAGLRLLRRFAARELPGPGGRAGRSEPYHLLPVHTSPGLFGPICTGIKAAGLAHAGSRMVVEKPIGRDLKVLPGHQRRAGRRLQRGPHLPGGPLPRQGGGAEPAGAALRQHPVRAALEQERHRPCADHRGRDRGGGGPLGLLRQLRRSARHGAEPPAAAPELGGHGAAGEP